MIPVEREIFDCIQNNIRVELEALRKQNVLLGAELDQRTKERDKALAEKAILQSQLQRVMAALQQE